MHIRKILAFVLGFALALGTVLTVAYAEEIVWFYDATKEVPPTVTIERAPAKEGPWWPIITVPGTTQQYIDSTVPPDWPQVWYRTRTEGGYGEVIGGIRKEYLAAHLARAEQKLAGICTAAKKMGGGATTFAGRIRMEVPCL